MSTYRKKLIEVALPLEAINAASAREKSIRHGHPSTLHLWWARRPHAAARAILFSQLVDDPSSWPELFPSEEAQSQERQRLFRIIEALVLWENATNETVLKTARLEIARSHARSTSSPEAEIILSPDATAEAVDQYVRSKLPAAHDPFAGGGTIPLEAQRLGLRVIASDLNPVAVMINKALVEIPPRFAGRMPVNPETEASSDLRGWNGARGLAEDVRYYGAWMREEAERRIGHLYPKVNLPDGTGSASVIAWLWARTVESPNPAFKGCHVPLVANFWLSTKVDRQTWIEPVVLGRDYRFTIRTGTPPADNTIAQGTKLGRGANFRCILSNAPIEPEYIKREAAAGRMSERMMAVVAEGHRQRVYLPPTQEMENAAAGAQPQWTPDAEFAKNSRHMTPWAYGLDNFGKLFTRRQLVALTTFCDLVAEVRHKIQRDAPNVDKAYADAIAIYLGLAVSRYANACSTICSWNPGDKKEDIRFTFSRQALGMTWDFAEGNPFSNSSGNFGDNIDVWLYKSLAQLGASGAPAIVLAADATSRSSFSEYEIISTDPPYFDNVPYADLSDFFYLWMRASLRETLPHVFATMLTPKNEELVSDAFRHGDSSKAEQFFMDGMRKFMNNAACHSAPGYPAALYYAFKQSEDSGEDGSGASSTGWEAFLQATIDASLEVVGTWPIRSERGGRMRDVGANALASSIVLVCRKRLPNASMMTRGEFRRLLRIELPDALKKLQQGNIAPVDVAQASIGPGMAIFSRHSQVLEADGKPMTVRSALQLINEVLDEYLASGEGDFDPDTRFAITWYEQHGWEAGPFGDAETLAKARNVSVSGVVEAGICKSAAGKVRILKRREMRPLDYDPATDERPTVWEFTQHLIRNLEEDGEEAAARLLKKLGASADATRELAYRLYNTCERRKWAEDARSYNGLILAWPELEKLASKVGEGPPPAPPSKAPSKAPAKAPKKASAKPKAGKKGQQTLFGEDK